MANIITNTLQIGSNNLVLRDADAQAKTAQLEENLVGIQTEALSAYATDVENGAIASFTDGANNVPVQSLTVEIEPVQDLNGYSFPWYAGGGKNLLRVITDTTQTINGVTFKVNSDGSITINGTASANAVFQLPNNVSYSAATLFSKGTSNEAVLVQARSGSSGSYTYHTATADGVSIPANTLLNQIFVAVLKGNTASNVTVYPMIRLATDTDATYAPYENICPITGHATAKVTRTGKNLLQGISATQTINGVTFTLNGDGSVTVNGTASANAVYQLPKNVSYPVPTVFSKGTANESVVLQARSGASGSYTYYTATENGVSIPANTLLNQIFIAVLSGNTADNVTIYPMIRLASDTDATFAPYNGIQLTFNLNGTRYGGTLDVITGTLVVDKALATVSESMIVRNSGTSWYVAFGGSYPSALNKGVSYYDGVISDKFKSGITANGVFVNASGTIRFNTKNEYASVADMYADIGEFSVCYPITPTTVQLTPQEVTTLLGQNNIWADCGDIDVEYRADTKKYIEKKIAGLA